jgi:predicted nucleic acid-binding protein
MIVIDAAALTNALIYADERGREGRTALRRDTEWAAPEHWKAEVFAAVRGLALGRKVGREQARRAIGRLPRLGVDHVSLDSLLPRMWQLRANISGCDAAYVALAEARELTLVTADSRLARAATQYCRVELAQP